MLELNEENLREYYSNKGYSIAELAVFFNKGKTTIHRWISKYNLIKYEKPEIFTEEFLYDEYITKHKSMNTIAIENNVGVYIIFSRLKKYNIVKTQEEVDEGRKEYNTKKYGPGITNVSQSPIIREKVKETVRKNYGTDNVFQAEEIKEKSKNTLMQKYGADNPQKVQSIKEHTEETNLKKYGDRRAVRNPEVRLKLSESIKATIPERKKLYKETIGVEWPTQLNKKITDDVDTFISKNLDKSVFQIAKDYNCSSGLVYNYIYDNGLDDKFIYKHCNRSQYEDDIAEIIQNMVNTEIRRTERTILDGHEIDIYLPDYKLGIEFNGDYWHSSLFKEYDYHLTKSLLAESKGVTLLHIFENEWNKDETTMTSLIKNFLGKAIPATNIIINQNRIYNDDDLIMTLSIENSVAEPISINYCYSIRDIFSSQAFKEYLTANNLALKLDYAKALHYFINDSYTLMKSTAPTKVYEYDGFDLFNCGYKIYHIGADILNE